MKAEKMSVFQAGEPNEAFKEYFVGQSYLTAGVKHWHGAAPDSWFQHLTVEVPGDNCRNEWCEAVSDEAYGKLK